MQSDQNLKLVFDTDEPKAGEIFISGQVDAESVLFLLDTGANFTSVVGIKSAVSYPSIRAINFQGISGVPQLGEVIVPKDFVVASQKFDKQELVRIIEGGGRKSTIGVNIFKDRSAYFDFHKKNLTFNRAPSANSLLQTFEIGKKGGIYLPVSNGAEQKPITAMWDTGAGLTLVDTSVVKDNPLNFEFVKKSSGGDTTGSTITLDIYIMKLLKVGRLEFKDITVLVADLSGIRNAIGDDIRVALGFNLITDHNWFFDLKNKKWTIE